MTKKVLKVVKGHSMIYIKTTTSKQQDRYNKTKTTTRTQYVFKYYDILGKKKQVTLPVSVRRIEEVIQKKKQKEKEVEAEKNSILVNSVDKRGISKVIAKDIQENKKDKTANTFDRIAYLYLDSHTHLKSHSKYVSIYENKLKSTFGNVIAHKLEDVHITRFYYEQLKRVAIKTANDYVQLIGTMFNYAIQKKKFKSINPFSTVKVKNPNNERKSSMSLKQIGILLEDKRINTNMDLKLFVLIATRTGARAGSIMNLRRQRIDLENNTITFLNYKKGNSSGDYLAYFDKIAKEVLKERFITCDLQEKIIKSTYASLRKKLQRIIDELFNYDDRDNDTELDEKGRVINREQLLYSPMDKKPISKKVLYGAKGLRKAKNEEELDEEEMEIRADRRKKRLVIHSLRHSFATNFLKQKGNNATIFKLKGLLDHSDIKMTLRYSKQDDEENKEAVINMFDE